MGFYLLPRIITVDLTSLPLAERKEPDYDQIQIRRYNNRGEEINPAITMSVDAKHKEMVNAEDPRALQTSDTGVVIGVTVVTKENSLYRVHPAFLIAKLSADNLVVSDEPVVFLEDYGKNFTPVSVNEFLFRRDGAGNIHKLELVKIEGRRLVTKKEIEFPKGIFWMEEKIGTTAAPIDLDDGTKLLIVHGVRAEKREGFLKHIYSLGLALLDNKWNLLCVEPDPFLTREDFANSGILPEGLELYKHRDVVYSCGYLIIGKDSSKPMIDLFVNVGDLMIAQTRLELSYLLRRIKEKRLYYRLPEIY